MTADSMDLVSRMGMSLVSGLDEVYQTADQYADSLTATAQLLCGLAAFVYIGARLWQSWARGESIDFYAMLRPFATGLLIVFFTEFTYCLDALTAPVVSATEYIRDSVTDRLTQDKSTYISLHTEMRNRKAKYEQEKLNKEQEPLSVWRTMNRNIAEIKDGLASLFVSAGSAANAYVIKFVWIVVELLTVAMAYFYKVYVVTAKIVLVLIGPFSFALSVVPGFASNLRAWVVHYLHVCLYIPICNLIGFVQGLVVSSCLYQPGIEAMQALQGLPMNDVLLAQVEGTSLMFCVAGIILCMISIMLYAKVPSFAGWIVRCDGAYALFHTEKRGLGES